MSYFNMLLKTLLGLLTIFLFAVPNAQATHLAGGDFFYECVGPNEYRIVLNLYRDCGLTSANLANTATICIKDDCNYNSSFVLALNGPATLLNPYCSTTSLTSECLGGTLPGLEHWQYESTVTLPSLPANCGNYQMIFDICCRNVSNNILNSTAQSFRVETVMDYTNNSCNNSPVFTSPPQVYYCANQVHQVNNYVIDPDSGDSLTFSLTDPQGYAGSCGPGVPLTHISPYTATVPIDNIIIDAATGQITFGPVTTTGVYVITMKVDEYNSSGLFQGSTLRDIQFVIENCTGNNQNPTHIASSSSVTGAGTLVSPTEVSVCYGQSFCFSTQFEDADVSDVLTLTSSIASTLPGAVVTVTGTNPITMDVCWTAVPTGNTFNNFFVTVQDNACPLLGTGSFAFTVHTVPGTYAGQDATICIGDQVELSGAGVPNLTWTSIAGDPINVGVNISCVNCPNPIVTPSQTTTYVLSSSGSTGCQATDTVTVTVDTNTVPPFNLVWGDPIHCGGDLGTVKTDIPDPWNYSFSWSSNTPSVGIQNGNLHLATILTSSDQTIELTVTVTANAGNGPCTSTATFYVTPAFNIGPLQDEYICFGETLSYTIPGASNVSVLWSPPSAVIDPNSATTDLFTLADITYDIAIFDSLCSDTIQLDVFVGDTTCVSGFMTTDTGGVLDSSWVYIYTIDSNNNFIVFDSAQTTSSGYYQICTSEPEFYLVVIPDPIQHPNQLPTYYPGDFLSQNAGLIVGNCGPIPILMSTVSGIPPIAGPASVGGLVIPGGSMKTQAEGIPDVEIYITDDQGQLLTIATTDDLGTFGFNNVPYGTYHLKLNGPQYTNANAPTVTLTSSNPDQNLVFFLWEDRLEYAYPLSVIAQDSENELAVFPNPGNGQVFVQWKGAEDLGVVSIELWDLLGKQVDVKPQVMLERGNVVPLNFEQAAGTYLLMVKSSGAIIYSEKLIINQ